MDDKQLDHLLDDAAQHWRVVADPPLDAIWQDVEAAAFDAPRRWRRPGWAGVGMAAAAALVIGVLGGRYSRRHDTIPTNTIAASPIAATHASMADDPDHRAMGELLGRTAVLLAALPADSASPTLDPHITREGTRLLTTTRLLLDSPLGANPRLRNLLQDLELVLAQVARLEPEHHHDEIQFIQTALDEHDLVPRLRSAAADLPLDDF